MSHNTATADIRILKQIFREALTIPSLEGSPEPLLEVNPMDRLQCKMPKAGVRRKREVVDEHRYQLLLSIAGGGSDGSFRVL